MTTERQKKYKNKHKQIKKYFNCIKYMERNNYKENNTKILGQERDPNFLSNLKHKFKN